MPNNSALKLSFINPPTSHVAHSALWTLQIPSAYCVNLEFSQRNGNFWLYVDCLKKTEMRVVSKFRLWRWWRDGCLLVSLRMLIAVRIAVINTANFRIRSKTSPSSSAGINKQIMRNIKTCRTSQTPGLLRRILSFEALFLSEKLVPV
jgi:hypothetical protein